MGYLLLPTHNLNARNKKATIPSPQRQRNPSFFVEVN